MSFESNNHWSKAKGRGRSNIKRRMAIKVEREGPALTYEWLKLAPDRQNSVLTWWFGAINWDDDINY